MFFSEEWFTQYAGGQPWGSLAQHLYGEPLVLNAAWDWNDY